MSAGQYGPNDGDISRLREQLNKLATAPDSLAFGVLREKYLPDINRNGYVLINCSEDPKKEEPCPWRDDVVPLMAALIHISALGWHVVYVGDDAATIWLQRRKPTVKLP